MLDCICAQSPTLAFFSLPGGWEWFVILIIGVLIFGKRLPDVAKGLGRSIVEFKKGIKGVEEEIDGTSTTPARPVERLADRSAETAPRLRSEEPIVATPHRRDDEPR